MRLSPTLLLCVGESSTPHTLADANLCMSLGRLQVRLTRMTLLLRLLWFLKRSVTTSHAKASANAQVSAFVTRGTYRLL